MSETIYERYSIEKHGQYSEYKDILLNQMYYHEDEICLAMNEYHIRNQDGKQHMIDSALNYITENPEVIIENRENRKREVYENLLLNEAYSMEIQ